MAPFAEPAQLTNLMTRNELSKCKGGTKTTFLYNYTFCFHFQNTFLLMCYTRGCTDAASPGASPTHSRCMKLTCAFPSIYTKQAIAKRKLNGGGFCCFFVCFSGHSEPTYLPYKDTKLFTLGDAPNTARPLGSSVESLQCARPVMGGKEGWDVATIHQSYFPTSTKAVPKLTWMAGGAGCLFPILPWGMP